MTELITQIEKDDVVDLPRVFKVTFFARWLGPCLLLGNFVIFLTLNLKLNFYSPFIFVFQIFVFPLFALLVLPDFLESRSRRQKGWTIDFKEKSVFNNVPHGQRYNPDEDFSIQLYRFAVSHEWIWVVELAHRRRGPLARLMEISDHTSAKKIATILAERLGIRKGVTGFD